MKRKAAKELFILPAPFILFMVHLSLVYGVWREFSCQLLPVAGYNVLGATDAVSHDFISVCNTSHINSLSVCELPEKISVKHEKDSIPVTIVPDNVGYQHCAYVVDRAKELKIKLLFLPSYSPNLNIIEHLWKWTKKDCLDCKHYSKFPEFVEAINHSRAKTANKENRDALNTHLSLNFQLYDNSIYDQV
ncbi:MAG: transposase [Prevotella sp.]|jgi:transposase|nr:transposase [Prevotella sp.]